MSQEDKNLLLIVLSVGLPYGIKVLNTAEGLNEICKLDSIMTSKSGKDCFVGLTLPDDSIMTGIEMVKPFLRPMSSMTEEEKQMLNNFASDMGDKWFDASSNNDRWAITIENNRRSVEYLCSKHLDLHGLIPKGFALEAPEGMYDI